MTKPDLPVPPDTTPPGRDHQTPANQAPCPPAEERAGEGSPSRGTPAGEAPAPARELPAQSSAAEKPPAKPVERLFPFVLRARILIIGGDNLVRAKSRLHFVLITRDLAAGSRAEILARFAHYPVVEHYTSADLERFFGIHGAKVLGFEKSSLAQSIYAELKDHRVNRPPLTTERPVPLQVGPVSPPGARLKRRSRPSLRNPASRETEHGRQPK